MLTRWNRQVEPTAKSGLSFKGRLVLNTVADLHEEQARSISRHYAPYFFIRSPAAITIL
jgi:hypothetical protein